MAKNWMANSVKHPGAFKSKAKKAGFSTTKFIMKVLAPGSKASAVTKRQARLARTFARYRRH